MNSGFPKTPRGRFSYVQAVPILLLALGIGMAAFVYFSHHRGHKKTTAAPDSIWEPTGIEQNLLRELAKTKNRSLSDEQVVTLKKALSPRKGEHVAMECTMGDLESCYLGVELNLIFEASGWTVEEFLFAVQSTPGEALILRVKDESAMPKAEFLSRLFRSVGLSVTTQTDNSQLYDLRIIVPSKKTPAA